MSQRSESPRLPEARRKEIFAALVTAQDLQLSVAESRRMVCAQFGISPSQVLEIEREGLDGGWPPF